MQDASKNELLAQAGQRIDRALSVLQRGHADVNRARSTLTPEQQISGERALRGALVATDRVKGLLLDALRNSNDKVGKGGAN